MSVELIITIALIFFVFLSVAAGAASLYLLKIARDRSKSQHEPEQSKTRGTENVVAPTEREIDIETFIANMNTGSLAPPGMRDQVITAAKAWRQVMPVISYAEWQRAMEVGRLFENIRRAQGTLDLIVPHTDYTQIISRATSENLEDLFHDRGHYNRSA